LAYGLEQSGFQVDTVSPARPFHTISPATLQQYHRIFFNGVQYFPHLKEHPGIVCRLRPLFFWGNWPRTDPNYGDSNNATPYQYDPRQILAPFPEDYNTFVGFFVHSLLDENNNVDDSNINSTSPAENINDAAWTVSSAGKPRTKQGFIIGRKAHLFDDRDKALMQTLLDNGFQLHSICTGLFHCGGLPAGVQIHSNLNPQTYAQFMKEMAFLIGFGDPIVSPSPLEGLAQGAAWINPIVGDNPDTNNNQEDLVRWTTGHPLRSQHRPLSLLGAPYVYNVRLDNTAEVLQAAEHAVRFRFDSYVPWEYRPSAMVSRACSIVEDDTVCLCAAYNNQHQLAQNSNNESEGNRGIDCRGSPYIRNPW